VIGDPLVELEGIRRHTGEPAPLRLQSLRVARDDRLVIAGLDDAAAEVFVNLITGAALPDEGLVRVGGRDTREIATDTDWLASLDRLGIVTRRAVLIDQLSIAANLALPLTLAVDPMPVEIRERLNILSREAGIAASRLDAPAATLTPLERIRVHLARAMAPDPQLLLLEHPTQGLAASDAQALGETLRLVSGRRAMAWIALSNDDGFARASGGTRLQLDRETGTVARARSWRWWPRR
jgi:ABC-type transporter Mla maintaining outer membrane lipid asymmetry ATPase subunit MlaF